MAKREGGYTGKNKRNINMGISRENTQTCTKLKFDNKGKEIIANGTER
jgi:hypothetical protein